MKKLYIIGASGHGKVVADIAVRCGYQEIMFLDDDSSIKSCGRYPVVGESNSVDDTEGDVIVAIGNPVVRRKIQKKIVKERLATLIHPDAVIAEDVVIGEGTVVMAGAVINSGSVIGRGCIVNTCASVDHDCELGNYVHVAVGAHVAGSVQMGEGTWVGAGAVISNNMNICEECIIGAGAVVVRNIEYPGIYIGIPARKQLKK